MLLLTASNCPDSFAVSILTRTEVRVLPPVTSVKVEGKLFQSSPAPRCGCCGAIQRDQGRHGGFNPHPHRGAGAARWYGADRIYSRCFNPHPHRGAGAALCSKVLALKSGKFQSSPAPRCGCCSLAAQGGGGCCGVSILTRTEVRVLQPRAARPSGPCCFNPHPHRGAGAAAHFQRPELQRLKVNFARTSAKLLFRSSHNS